MTLLLLVVEDAREGVQGFGAFRVASESGTSGGNGLALLMGLREQGVVRGDEIGRPEGLKGLVVERESFGRVTAARFKEGLRADGEGSVMWEGGLETGNESLRGGVVFLIKQ